MDQKKLKMILAILAVVITVMVLILIPVLGIIKDRGEAPETEYTLPGGTTSPEETEYNSYLKGYEVKQTAAIAATNSLTIDSMGTYTGLFLEGGEDLGCKDILAVIVTNNGNEDLQYVEFYLPAGEERYHFTISVLPAGATALVMEKNAKAYPDVTFTQAEDVVTTYFSEPMSAEPEHFKIEGVQGLLTITNLGKSFETPLYVCYRTIEDGIYIGGVAYRVTVKGGMKEGEYRQMGAPHYSPENSHILWVWTTAEEA